MQDSVFRYSLRHFLRPARAKSSSGWPITARLHGRSCQCCVLRVISKIQRSTAACQSVRSVVCSLASKPSQNPSTSVIPAVANVSRWESRWPAASSGARRPLNEQLTPSDRTSLDLVNQELPASNSCSWQKQPWPSHQFASEVRKLDNIFIIKQYDQKYRLLITSSTDWAKFAFPAVWVLVFACTAGYVGMSFPKPKSAVNSHLRLDIKQNRLTSASDQPVLLCTGLIRSTSATKVELAKRPHRHQCTAPLQNSFCASRQWVPSCTKNGNHQRQHESTQPCYPLFWRISQTLGMDRWKLSWLKLNS